MKIISGIITSMLLALGLLVAAAPAQADHGYPPSIATHCDSQGVRSTFTTKQYIRTLFRLKTNGGGFPDASVSVRIKNNKTGNIVRVANRHYEFRTEKFRFSPLPRGTYTFRYVATPDNDRYKPCVTKHQIRIVRR
ncbi:MAG: hypothetical protein ABWX84_03045 [Nocardioides sp.]